jgi:hypothetical protein
MSKSSEGTGQNSRCRESWFMLRKLLFGYYLILLTGIAAFGLLLLLMWVI